MHFFVFNKKEILKASHPYSNYLRLSNYSILFLLKMIPIVTVGKHMRNILTINTPFKRKLSGLVTDVD